jgi:hypothetical protein
MPFPILPSNSATGYFLTKSLRFRSSASAYITKSYASSGNRKTWTWSYWIKRGILSTSQIFAGTADSSGNYGTYFYWLGGDTLRVQDYSTTGVWTIDTTQVFRDPSAWYHIVLAVDTTQATSSNRVKIYLNGVQVTALATATYPSLNYDCYMNSNANPVSIGRMGSYNSAYGDMYMSEVNFIDGQALTPSSFGSTNSLTGVWQPAKYTGTYGTNGFYLPFTNTTSTTTIGYDFSGNSNNFTSSNISLTTGSTYDSMNDVTTLTSATTANYCVLNPLAPPPWAGSNYALSNGNLTSTYGYQSAPSTFAISNSGAWYWEVTCTTNCDSSQNNSRIGIVPVPYGTGTPGDMTGSYVYTATGQKGASNTYSSYGASYTNGDVIGIAFDSGAGSITFYKNGTSQGTAYTGITGTFYAMNGSGSASGTVSSTNFGQQPFAYTPPTGFVALNTYNLPTPTIGATTSTLANKNFDINLYTGTSASQSIVNAQSFQPSFVWLKSRSNATDHVVHDVLRGTAGINRLFPNLTRAESTTGDGFLSINSNGFSLDSSGAGGDVNTTGRTYVAWQWAGPASGSSNTSGSITSTVSVNASAGFSVVTYTGTGSTATVGHGLGVAPSMIIIKCRPQVTDWPVYHISIGATNYLNLNETRASTSNSAPWNNTDPTSSVFTVGTSYGTNYPSNTLIAYCWAEIAGFSKFGSYTGNGSSDGPFVYTGFRPKYIMIKKTSATNDWFVLDTSRSPYNVCAQVLYPNDTYVEDNGTNIDILSNGFKCRNTASGTNASSATYIYMAFAENPYKYSLAR